MRKQLPPTTSLLMNSTFLSSEFGWPLFYFLYLILYYLLIDSSTHTISLNISSFLDLSPLISQLIIDSSTHTISLNISSFLDFITFVSQLIPDFATCIEKILSFILSRNSVKTFCERLMAVWPFTII